LKGNVRNIKSVIFGTSIGLLLLFAGAELIQLFTAYLAGAENLGMKFETIYFRALFKFPDNSGKFLTGVTYMSPVIFILFVIEITTRIITGSKPGAIRYTSILIQLICIGFAMIKIFYSTFMMVLAPEYETDWNSFLFYGQIQGTIGYITTLILLIMIVAYLGNTTARIKRYIEIH